MCGANGSMLGCCGAYSYQPCQGLALAPDSVMQLGPVIVLLCLHFPSVKQVIVVLSSPFKALLELRLKSVAAVRAKMSLRQHLWAVASEQGLVVKT